jgi:hypothetical protein
MPLPPRYLATKLADPLPTTDGGVLRTIGGAIAYMTALPKHRELKQAWAARVQADLKPCASRGDHAPAQPRAVHGCQARSRREARAR